MEDQWGRPIGLAAFVDMVYDDYFVDTKRNVLDDEQYINLSNIARR
ncbi:hypothetical protein NSA31_04735 [Bacillus subtilis]|nr:hypothetical protein [Bacillus subtilis]MCR1991097.1 hypothetical protein [Bacillus subtilis]